MRPEPDYLTFSAFAKAKRISLSTVRAAVASGRLRAHAFPVGNTQVWRIHRDELRTYKPDPKKVAAAKKARTA